MNSERARTRAGEGRPSGGGTTRGRGRDARATGRPAARAPPAPAGACCTPSVVRGSLHTSAICTTHRAHMIFQVIVLSRKLHVLYTEQVYCTLYKCTVHYSTRTQLHIMDLQTNEHQGDARDTQRDEHHENKH